MAEKTEPTDSDIEGWEFIFLFWKKKKKSVLQMEHGVFWWLCLTFLCV